MAPLGAGAGDEARQVRGVVGAEAEGEHQQRPQGQAYGPQAAAPADPGPPGEDADEVDVAEAGDDERDAEQQEAQLQPEGQEHPQLLRREVPVTASGGAAVAAVAGGVVVRNDVDDAQVQGGQDPEEHADQHGIQGPALQFVPDGEGHSQVALHADCRQEERAVVDGGVEDEHRQRAQEMGHGPRHVVRRLLHGEGEEEEEDQVGDGEVEEQDVDGDGFPSELPAEGAEGQNVGWQADQKGDDGDGQDQLGVACQHPGSGGSWEPDSEKGGRQILAWKACCSENIF